MNTRQYFEACGLSPETANAFATIRAGRHAVETARREADARAERASRRRIDAARKAVREPANLYA